jgi:hypothetical protein
MTMKLSVKNRKGISDDCFSSDSYFDNAKIKINGKELKYGNKVLRKR